MGPKLWYRFGSPLSSQTGPKCWPETRSARKAWSPNPIFFGVATRLCFFSCFFANICFNFTLRSSKIVLLPQREHDFDEISILEFLWKKLPLGATFRLRFEPEWATGAPKIRKNIQKRRFLPMHIFVCFWKAQKSAEISANQRSPRFPTGPGCVGIGGSGCC